MRAEGSPEAHPPHTGAPAHDKHGSVTVGERLPPPISSARLTGCLREKMNLDPLPQHTRKSVPDEL